MDSVNSPVNGLITGRIDRGGLEGKVVCAAMVRARTVLFCAGQSPDSNSAPFNLVLVSDALRFTKGVGAGGGPVYDVVYDSASGKTYVAGAFTSFEGQDFHYLVRLNSDSTLDTSFATWWHIFGAVRSVALAPDGSGDVYIGGDFDEYEGTSINHVMRLNSDGSLDTAFNPGTALNGAVYSVAVAADGSNKIYIGGEFTAYSGSSTHATRIARLNTDGTLDATFATGTGATNTSGTIVRKILPLSSGKVYIGGYFPSFNGTSPVNHIVLLNSNGSIDTSFNTTGGTSGATGFNDAVFEIALALDGSNDLYVGGYFTDYQGVESSYSSRLIRLNSDGTPDNGFNTGDGLEVYGWADAPIVTKLLPIPAGSPGSSAGDVLVLGEWQMFNNSTDYPRIIRLNSGGSVDTEFQRTYSVHQPFTGAIIGTTGEYWVAGNMHQIYTRNIGQIARITYNETFAYNNFSLWGRRGLDGPVKWFGIAPANNGTNSIYVTGHFDTYNGAYTSSLIRLTENGTVDRGFNVAIDASWSYGVDGYDDTGLVVATADGSKVYVSGLTTVTNTGGTTTVGRIARFNSNGTFDTTFVQGSGFDGRINMVLPLSNGDVFVTGQYSNYNGNAAPGMILLNSDGSVDSSFNPGTGISPAGREAHIFAAADGSGKYYVVGTFTSYNGTSINRAFRMNANGTIDSAFNVGTGFDAEPWTAVPLANGQVYFGGEFTTYNGTSVGKVIRVNSNGTLDTSFDTSPSGGFNNIVSCLSLANDGTGDLYVGGYFWEYRGAGAGRIVRLNSDGTRDSGFVDDPAANDWVTVIIPRPGNTTGQIYVGGNFSAFDVYGADYIARVTATGATD